MTIHDFNGRILHSEILAGMDDASRAAAFAEFESAAAAVEPEADRIVAGRALLVLRNSVGDHLRFKGCRFNW